MKKKKLPCDECNSTFQAKPDLQLHKNAVHRQQKDFKCLQCEKPFAFRSYLVKHVQTIHLQIAKGWCNLCKKEKLHIEKHMKLFHEANSRKYECDCCHKALSSKQNLIVHLKQKHGKGNLTQFVCQLCQKTFYLKTSLTRHLKFHHHDMKPKCDICGKKVHRLERHMNIVHSRMPFECHKCGKLMSTEPFLKRHLKIIHKQKV